MEKIGAISRASSFSINGGMLSGPVALNGLIFNKSFWIPWGDIKMLSMALWGGVFMEGVSWVGRDQTEENWLLRMLALISGLFCSSPFLSFNWAHETLSFLCDLIKFQKSFLLLLESSLILFKYRSLAFLHSILHFFLISKYLLFTRSELVIFHFLNHLYF